MIRIVKLLYSLSVLVFLVVLLYIYAFLPETVGVYFDEQGAVLIRIERSDFFYGALGLFILTNGLISLYRRINSENVSENEFHFEGLSPPEIMYHWMGGLSFIFNVIYIFSIAFIGIFHSTERFDVADYIILIYIGPALLLGWIFWFIYLKFSNK